LDQKPITNVMFSICSLPNLVTLGRPKDVFDIARNIEYSSAISAFQSVGADGPTCNAFTIAFTNDRYSELSYIDIPNCCHCYRLSFNVHTVYTGLPDRVVFARAGRGDVS